MKTLIVVVLVALAATGANLGHGSKTPSPCDVRLVPTPRTINLTIAQVAACPETKTVRLPVAAKRNASYSLRDAKGRKVASLRTDATGRNVTIRKVGVADYASSALSLDIRR